MEVTASAAILQGWRISVRSTTKPTLEYGGSGGAIYSKWRNNPLEAEGKSLLQGGDSRMEERRPLGQSVFPLVFPFPLGTIESREKGWPL